MKAELQCTFRFEAAHWLPNVPPGHYCARMHGHSYEVELHLSGDVDEEHGWVVDFEDVRHAFAPLREQLDHCCLNEVEDLDNPTSEHLASWIYARIVDRIPGLEA